MNIDLSRFHQVFFEEAEEHLQAMETLLLGLDPQQPAAEDLNAIFRAAHSIKGGSGTFGFSDIAGVTHVAETLLDRLRKGELALTTAMVDAFLRTVDLVKVQLSAHRYGDGEVSASEAENVCAVLTRLSTGDDPVPPPSRRQRCWQLVIAPLPGDGLGALLERLGEVGRIQSQTCQDAALQLQLLTDLDPSELRELIGFFLNTAGLSVDVAEMDAASSDPTSSGGAADSGSAYGFFDDPAPASVATEADDAFGFFEAAPGLPDSPAAAAESAYGLFVTETEAAQLRDQARGYGFFDEASLPLAEPSPVAAARKPEAVVNAARGSDTSSSIRVGVEKVDQLVNLVGELVITQAMLAQSVSEADAVLQEKLLAGLALLERNTRDLQEAVMSIRMMPVRLVFSRFPRMVRDLAGQLGKQVSFRSEGEGTELDKGLLEKITDPLTHLVRNSLDHGIEDPAARAAAAKPVKGSLVLRAYHQGGNVIIEVQDDGAGLGRERILAKARERGLNVSDGMTDGEVWQLIFAPGFSTAERVTDVSGRGVGMDVVKKNIESLGGKVEIESVRKAGTKVTIRLPLTLAILDGLSIGVGDEIFIVPLTSIVESMQLRPEDVRTVTGQGRLVQVRGEYLPLVAVGDVFGIAPRTDGAANAIVMIVESDGLKGALLVDDLLGQNQVVIKSLETNYRKVAGISGATILGDGRVALILDVASVMRSGRIVKPRWLPAADGRGGAPAVAVAGGDFLPASHATVHAIRNVQKTLEP